MCLDELARDLIDPWKQKKRRKLEHAPAVISAYCDSHAFRKGFFEDVVQAFEKARKDQCKHNLPIIQVGPGNGMGMEQLLGADDEARSKEFQRCLRKSGLESAGLFSLKRVGAFSIALLAWFWAEGAKGEEFGSLYLIASLAGAGVGWFVGSFFDDLFGMKRGAESIQNQNRLQKKLREDNEKRLRLHKLICQKMHESARVVVIHDFQALDNASKSFLEAYFATYKEHSHTWLDEQVEVWFFCDTKHPSQLRSIFGRIGQAAFVPDYLKLHGETEDHLGQDAIETRTPPVRLLNDLSKATHLEARLLAAFCFYGDNTLTPDAFHELVAEDDFNGVWAERLLGPDYRKLSFNKLQKVAARLTNCDEPSLMAPVLKPMGHAQIWFGNRPGPLIQKHLPWTNNGGVEKSAAFLVLRLTHLSGSPALTDSSALIHNLLHHLLDECLEWVRGQSLEKELWRCAYQLMERYVLNLRFDRADELFGWIEDRCPFEAEFQGFGSIIRNARILTREDGWPTPSKDSIGGLMIQWLFAEIQRTIDALDAENDVLADASPPPPRTIMDSSAPRGLEGALNALALSHWFWITASELLDGQDPPAELIAAIELATGWEKQCSSGSVHAIEELAIQSLALTSTVVGHAAELAGKTLVTAGLKARRSGGYGLVGALEGDMPGMFSQYFISLAQIEGSAVHVLLSRGAARFLTARYKRHSAELNDLARNDAFLELLTEEAYGALVQLRNPAAFAGFLFLAEDAREVYCSLNNDKSMRYLAESAAVAPDDDFKFAAGAMLFRYWSGDGKIVEARRDFVNWLGPRPPYQDQFARLDIFAGEKSHSNIFLLLWNFQQAGFEEELALLRKMFVNYSSDLGQKALDDWRLLERLSDTPQELEVTRACQSFGLNEHCTGMYLLKVIEKLRGGLPSWLLELCHKYLRDCVRAGTTTTIPLRIALAIRAVEGFDSELVHLVLFSYRDIYNHDHPSKGLDLLSAICQLEHNTNEENLALRRSYAARTVEYFLDHDLQGLAIERQHVVAMHHLIGLLNKVQAAFVIAPVRPVHQGENGGGADIELDRESANLLVNEKFWEDLCDSLQIPVTGSDIVGRSRMAWLAWLEVYQNVKYRAKLRSTVNLEALDKLTSRMARFL